MSGMLLAQNLARGLTQRQPSPSAAACLTLSVAVGCRRDAAGRLRRTAAASLPGDLCDSGSTEGEQGQAAAVKRRRRRTGRLD